MPAGMSKVPSKSVTMEEDKSCPPTPDGTGLPTNFHMVGPGIFRSSYPQAAHFDALTTFNFRTIITLVPESIPPANVAFMALGGTTHHHIPVLPNKDADPASSTPEATVLAILALLLDPANHPVLLHCNKGKHRTGCLIACLRKVTGWTDTACIAEYERFSRPKDRALDKAFIARFQPPGHLKAAALDRGFVGGAFAQRLLTESNRNLADMDVGVDPKRASRDESDYTVGTAVTSSDWSSMV
jgi:hypothetical protein